MIQQDQEKHHYPDHSEKIQINALSLLKMLKHAKQGIPLEVIGLILGKRVDDFTIEIFDVFSTPQVATGVNVESREEEFQAEYTELLERTGYEDLVNVGWYHSHPGFDVYFSPTDFQNQYEHEKLDPRYIGIVVDPVLSVKGKAVIGAFRCRHELSEEKGLPNDPRPKTSVIGFNTEYRSVTINRGLNSIYYQIKTEFKMNKSELHMLNSLYRPNWTKGYEIPSFAKNDAMCLQKLKELTKCAKGYRNEILSERNISSAQDKDLIYVGRVDPKLFLKETTRKLSNTQVSLMSMLHIAKQSLRKE